MEISEFYGRKVTFIMSNVHSESKKYILISQMLLNIDALNFRKISPQSQSQWMHPAQMCHIY